MKIDFYIGFQTKVGENLLLNANILDITGRYELQPTPMQYFNEEFWSASIEVDPAEVAKVFYSYAVTYADGSLIKDGERDRVINLSEIASKELITIDTWSHQGAGEHVFYTSPFQNILLSENGTESEEKDVELFTHIFKVKAPLLQKNEVVILLGSSFALGGWNKNQCLFMANEGRWWTIKVNIPHEDFPLEYKYGIYNKKEKTLFVLESHENRRLHGNASQAMLTILHDGFARFPYYNWKGAGVAVPVFSLRTMNGFGVGEFEDIKVLIDWASDVGMKLIQLLPVNDTTATHTFADSYPYAAISAFALHPIYINLEKVAGKDQYALIKQLEHKQSLLNDLPELDYEGVMKLKLESLKALYAGQKEEYLHNEDFQAFFNSNRHWLVPYAAFCYLRDKNGTADFCQWEEYGVYEKETIEELVSPVTNHYHEIFLHYFIQYHLHLQLKDATEYAHKKGIIVKGDIPIGIYRHSCDAWESPELYNLDMQAGAPPDQFAVKGQNWGFPTYNWKKMQEDGFAWWRRRFEQMSTYFDAFRIDHILGFFRIWSIPLHAVEGIMGYFVPSFPIHINEFSERNIWFDYERYTKPFITDQVLYNVFGEEIKNIKQEYLNELSVGWYELKEAYNTQHKTEAYFNGIEQNDENNKIKTGLFDLISNVILFEVESSQGTRFNFRINMENTTSFQNLHENTQKELKELYINYFYQRQDNFWKKEAMNKLPALKAVTNMLICGEDLGMVPHCVPQVMNELGILSLEIQRMPKDPTREFFHPNDAPYLSVVTPSTHDMSTIRGWWEEDKAQIQRFFNHELGQRGDAPFFCEPWIVKAVILQHLYSPAMWSIFQLQDLLGMSDTLRRQNPNEERINIPADPKHYWRYRMHFTLEDLQRAEAFNNELKNDIVASGR